MAAIGQRNRINERNFHNAATRGTKDSTVACFCPRPFGIEAALTGQDKCAGVSNGVVMAFVLELWAFLRARKKLWLFPVIVMMAVLGGLVILSKGSMIAPLIYTLF